VSVKLQNLPKDTVARDIKVIIQLYKQVIELAEKENDYTLKELFEQILADEEEYQEELVSVAEKEE
jgi:bacterioferritin (cytochrome b1)